MELNIKSGKAKWLSKLGREKRRPFACTRVGASGEVVRTPRVGSRGYHRAAGPREGAEQDLGEDTGHEARRGTRLPRTPGKAGGTRACLAGTTQSATGAGSQVSHQRPLFGKKS